MPESNPVSVVGRYWGFTFCYFRSLLHGRESIEACISYRSRPTWTWSTSWWRAKTRASRPPSCPSSAPRRNWTTSWAGYRSTDPRSPGNCRGSVSLQVQSILTLILEDSKFSCSKKLSFSSVHSKTLHSFKCQVGCVDCRRKETLPCPNVVGTWKSFVCLLLNKNSQDSEETPSQRTSSKPAFNYSQVLT